jgi:hypothetical protein
MLNIVAEIASGRLNAVVHKSVMVECFACREYAKEDAVL